MDKDKPTTKHFDLEEDEKLEATKIGSALPKIVDNGSGKETHDGLDMVKQ